MLLKENPAEQSYYIIMVTNHLKMEFPKHHIYYINDYLISCSMYDWQKLNVTYIQIARQTVRW